MNKGRENVLHPLRTTSPVAVVEVDAAALEDECADAILGHRSATGVLFSIT